MKRLAAIVRARVPWAHVPWSQVAAPAGALAGAIGLAVVLAVAIGAAANRDASAPFLAALSVLGAGATWLDMLARSGMLMLTGLSVALAYRAGLFNLGAEGQLMAGMMAAAGVAGLPIGPATLAVPAALVAGTLAGAAMMAVPAALKVRRGADEAILTLIANAVVLFCFELVARPAAPAPAAGLGLPLRALVGVAIGLAACALCDAVLRATVFGLEIRATGGNPAAARFAGIRAGRVMVGTGAIAGALAGLAGAAIAAGLAGVPAGVPAIAGTGGLGYAGIAVAVMAAAHPRAIVPAALALAAVVTLVEAAGRATGTGSWLADLMLGLAVLLTLVGRRFAARRFAPRGSRP